MDHVTEVLALLQLVLLIGGDGLRLVSLLRLLQVAALVGLPRLPKPLRHSRTSILESVVSR